MGAGPVEFVALGAPDSPNLAPVESECKIAPMDTVSIDLELLNDTIKTRDDIRDKLGLACISTIEARKPG